MLTRPLGLPPLCLLSSCLYHRQLRRCAPHCSVWLHACSTPPPCTPCTSTPGFSCACTHIRHRIDGVHINYDPPPHTHTHTPATCNIHRTGGGRRTGAAHRCAPAGLTNLRGAAQLLRKSGSREQRCTGDGHCRERSSFPTLQACFHLAAFKSKIGTRTTFEAPVARIS